MAALSPYRAFNRSRAGSELVVGDIAPDVSLTRLVFPAHSEEERGESAQTQDATQLPLKPLRGPLKVPAGVVSMPQRMHSLAREAGRVGKLCVVAAGSFT